METGFHKKQPIFCNKLNIKWQNIWCIVWDVLYFGQAFNNGQKISFFFAAESANIVISHVTFMAQKYCFRTKCAWSKKIKLIIDGVELDCLDLWCVLFIADIWLSLLNDLTVIPVEAAVVNSLFPMFISLMLSLLSILILCPFQLVLRCLMSLVIACFEPGHKLLIYLVICLEIDPAKLRELT